MDCQICRHPTKLILSKERNVSCGDYFVGHRLYMDNVGETGLFECTMCGFASFDELSGWSEDRFRRDIYNADYHLCDPPFREERPRKFSAWLAECLSPRSLIDYGGGEGRLAELLSARGFEAQSFDPFYGDTTVPAHKGDVVTAFEVVEHVPIQRDLFSRLIVLCKHDGLIIFSTLLKPKTLDGDWWYASARNGHVSFHTDESLNLFMKDMGLAHASLSPELHVAAFDPIKTLADLKGKTVAANSFGSGGGFSLRESLNELSIPEGQYSQVTMSPGPAAFAALQSGKIDALVLWDAMLGAAENSGMKLRRVPISFQDRLAGMSIAANGDLLKSQPEVVEGYCRAMTKALVFTKANPQAAVKLFWEEFPTAKPTTGTDEANIQNATHILGRFLEMALQGQQEDAPLGAFIPDAWKNTYATFVKLGTIKGNGSATEAYSSRFIKACNDFDKQAVLAEAAKS